MRDWEYQNNRWQCCWLRKNCTTKGSASPDNERRRLHCGRAAPSQSRRDCRHRCPVPTLRKSLADRSPTGWGTTRMPGGSRYLKKHIEERSSTGENIGNYVLLTSRSTNHNGGWRKDPTVPFGTRDAGMRGGASNYRPKHLTDLQKDGQSFGQSETRN
jgi:hypothetical protein